MGRGAVGTVARAQIGAHAHPRVGPVRHGARLERHERGDLADRQGPRHDDPGRPDSHHPVHARDGGEHVARRFSERITDNPAVPAAARQAIVANAEQGIDIVPVATVEQGAAKGGLTPDQARAVAADYGDAQLDALRLSLGAVALAALLSLWLTRRLPTTSLAEGQDGRAGEPAAATSADLTDRRPAAGVRGLEALP
jgi:hypothetical protein